MSLSPSESLERLVAGHYAAWTGVADLAERWAALARTATRAVRAEIAPAAAGPLREALGAARADGLDGRPGVVGFPIRYQASELGRLLLEAPALEAAAVAETGRDLARGLAFEVMRLELSAAVRARFGCEPPWIGPSPALRRLDRFVEQAARSVLPILLTGGEGAQAETVALALHLAGPRAAQRAVRLRCSILEPATLERQVARYVRAAAGGTLVLSRLDELAPDCQPGLCRLLDAEALAHEGLTLPASELPVWAATASPAIDEAAEAGRFHRPLLDRLGILRLGLEPLRHRRADIGYLFQHCFRALAPTRPSTLTAEILSALGSYPWPGDVAELRRVAARLAVMVEEGAVQTAHLLQFTPQLLSPALRAAPPVETRGPLAARGPAGDPADERGGERGALAPLPAARHPAVRRAFAFLLANFRRKLPLSEVAGHVFVSPSRLAHLFRQDLGATFTQVLARIRIEQAKQLLTSLPWEPITAVAAAVGFADLRHFERVFKLFEGCTPKEFRRLYGESQGGRKKGSPLDPRAEIDRLRSETS